MEIAEIRRCLLDAGVEDDLPGILSARSDVHDIRLRLGIPPELRWFRGHFPGRPVLPGIVQVHWAVRVSMAHFGFRSVPTVVNRLKFKHVIVPPSVIELSIARVAKSEVSFGYTGAGTKYSEGRLVFKGEEQ